MHARIMGSSPERAVAKGAATGSKSPMVPQEVPVENATTPAKTKITNGNATAGKLFPTIPTNARPVEKSSQTFLMTHAKIKMAQASNSVPKPSI